ncbi:MAG: hypothetical protein ACREM1_20005, partial [Longimicrobiales bacterium]
AAHEVAEHAALHGAREPLGVFGTEARGLVEAKRAVVSGREEATNDDESGKGYGLTAAPSCRPAAPDAPTGLPRIRSRSTPNVRRVFREERGSRPDLARRAGLVATIDNRNERRS